jgi:tetratricopeptide (TPR) repeat protein
MKNYCNEEHGFEIKIPDEWSIYEGKGNDHSPQKGHMLVFKCRKNEAFNVQIAPFTTMPFRYEVELEFQQSAEKKGYTSLEIGRITIDGQEHVWARYYIGGGLWAKKYRIILNGFDYTITATCLEQRELLAMEKVWDEVISSFRLFRTADETTTSENKSTHVVLPKMKTYRNDELDFEIKVPESWTGPTVNSPTLSDKSVVFGCGTDEAFNIQIGPLVPEPTLDFTERHFTEFALNNNCSNLEFGRITVEGKQHVWARYFMKFGGWTKKYMIVLGGMEYAITATCYDFKLLTGKEKVWDELVNSLCLGKRKQQTISEIETYRKNSAGELYAKAYQAVSGERYLEARSLLEQCLRDDPNHVLAHKELAIVLKKTGDLRGALTHRIEVKHLDPSDTINRYNLADILSGLGKNNLANQEIKELQAMGTSGINKTTQYQRGLNLVFQAASLFENKNGNRVENLKNAIRNFNRALEIFTRQDYPEDWVMAQNCLGETYRHLSLLEDSDDNLSQAIFHYEQALTIATRTTYPEIWAAAHNNLGIAYANGTRADLAENVEKAISHCQQALEFYTRNTLPDDWAMTQNNLGETYRKRLQGDRAENIEQAISNFQQALEIQNHQTDREQWAGTHNNLSSAYWERLRGDRAENLEKAIFHAQQALEVYKIDTHPKDWAYMHHGLSATYQVRIRGNRTDNIEKAIHHAELALKVISYPVESERWAKVQTILGLAYQDRKQGDRADNIEKSISYFLHALQVFTMQAFPTDWSATQIYLAYAYQDRVRGERAENMERSIDYFQQALKVCTREAYREQWAVAHNSLAMAYMKRQKGDRSENFDQAIRHCQQQLEVHTRQSYPERWAMAQFFLGMIMMDRKNGEKLKYTGQAIQYYQQALEIFTREKYPEEWEMVQNGLALAYKERDPNVQKTQGSLAGVPPLLTYPDFYNEESKRQSGEKCRLKLIYSDVPDDKYATSMLLVYQWEAELSREEADRLKRRTVAYLCCAIYDIAKSIGIPCMTSPIPNGMRPAWMFQGERSPVSLTLSDMDMSDRTLQMSIGPVVVALHSLPVNKVPLKKLLEGFRDKFNDIYV